MIRYGITVNFLEKMALSYEYPRLKRGCLDMMKINNGFLKKLVTIVIIAKRANKSYRAIIDDEVRLGTLIHGHMSIK
jgi:hypothetical protein